MSRPALPLVWSLGTAVSRCREHRRARDVARGRGRRAVDTAGRRRRRRSRARHAGRGRRRSAAAMSCWRSTTPGAEVEDVVAALHAPGADARSATPSLRLGTREVIDVRLAPFPAVPACCTSCSRPSASSRCSSAARCGCGVRAIRRRCISSGSPSRSSACSRSRSAAVSIVSTGCSTGPTRSRFWCCRRSFSTSRWSFPSGRAAGAAGASGTCCVARCVSCRRCCSASPGSSPLRRSGAMPRAFVAAIEHARAPRVLLSGDLPDRRPRRSCRARLSQVSTITARRQLRWIVWGTALGTAPFALRLRAAVRAGRRAVAADGAVGHSAQPDSARVRLCDRPLPSDGHRGDRQARAGVRGGALGDRR